MSARSCQLATRLRGRGVNCDGFTLVELFVVASVIIVLASLAFPVFQKVQNSARKTQAKNDLVQIVTAVNAFYTEYGKYPLPTTVTTDALARVGPGGSGINGPLFNELRGLPAATLNTRLIVFMSPPEAKDQTNSRNGIKTLDGQLFDPWGMPYAISIDWNYDNQIPNPYTPNKGAGGPAIRQGVIAWSLGNNGALGGGAAAGAGYSKENGNANEFTSSGDVISWQ